MLDDLLAADDSDEDGEQPAQSSAPAAVATRTLVSEVLSIRRAYPELSSLPDAAALSLVQDMRADLATLRALAANPAPTSLALRRWMKHPQPIAVKSPVTRDLCKTKSEGKPVTIDATLRAAARAAGVALPAAALSDPAVLAGAGLELGYAALGPTRRPGWQRMQHDSHVAPIAELHKQWPVLQPALRRTAQQAGGASALMAGSAAAAATPAAHSSVPAEDSDEDMLGALHDVLSASTPSQSTAAASPCAAAHPRDEFECALDDLLG